MRLPRSDSRKPHRSTIWHWALVFCYKLALMLSLLGNGIESETQAEAEKSETKKFELEKDELASVQRYRKRTTQPSQLPGDLLAHPLICSSYRQHLSFEMTPRPGHFLPNGLNAPLHC